MTRIVLRRGLLSLVVIAGVVVLTFLIARIVPGDPAVAWAGPRATSAEVAKVSHDLGLDTPVIQQIGSYFAGVFTGDWGLSVHTRQPVLHDLLVRIPPSLELVVASLVLALIIAIPLGLISARYSRRAIDHTVRSVAVAGVSIPVFWLALILQLVFFQVLHWLPVAGDYAINLKSSDPLTTITGAPVIDALLTANWPIFGSALVHLILPALAIASYPIGVVTRMVRAIVIETAGQPFIQMLRALGFSERVIYAKFALRLVWGPIVQVLALVFVYSLVNTFLVEAIFNWPGLGSYAADSVSSLDTPAIVGLTLFIGITYVVANLIVDVVQAWLDPRIRQTA